MTTTPPPTLPLLGGGEIEPLSPSRLPLEEVGDQGKPESLALLGVELATREIVRGDESGDGTAIVGAGDKRVRPLRQAVGGVHEMGVGPSLVGRDAVQELGD